MSGLVKIRLLKYSKIILTKEFSEDKLEFYCFNTINMAWEQTVIELIFKVLQNKTRDLSQLALKKN